MGYVFLLWICLSPNRLLSVGVPSILDCKSALPEQPLCLLPSDSKHWTSLIFIPWFGIPVAHGECKFRHTCGWYSLQVDFSSRAPSRNRLFSLLSWAGGQSFLDSLRERASFPGLCLSIGISGLIPIECETQNHISCSEQLVKSRPRSLPAFYSSRPVLTASVEDPAFSLSPEDLPLFLLLAVP